MSTEASKRCDCCKKLEPTGIYVHDQSVALPRGWARVTIQRPTEQPKQPIELCASCADSLEAKLDELADPKRRHAAALMSRHVEDIEST
jgi:hypothetical protein